MSDTVYINGQYFPAEQATVSVYDRGMLFGDGVYEVIPVYHGQIYFLDRHLKRLATSLNESKISMPATDWPEVLND